MTGIRVVTDSSCDLPAALVDELAIEIVPLSIRFGNETLIDREQLTVDDFWQRCASMSTLPETAAPSAGLFEDRFRQLAADGATGIVCVNLSQALSATYQSALIAARSVSDAIPVSVVDSRSVSMGLGFSVLAAAEAAALGKDLDDVVGAAENTAARTKVFAALDTLDHLKRGGRIGAAQAMIGSLLSFKPIIEISGTVDGSAKQRTRQKSLAHLLNLLREAGPVERVAVVDGHAPDIEAFASQVNEIVGADQVIRAHLGPVVGTHGGPGLIGLAWVTAD